MYENDRGQRVLLDRRLGGGGEGDVYTIKGSALVAKIIHPHARTQERSTKLQVMVRNPPEDPTQAQGHSTLCWPRELLFEGRDIAGFLMPAIDGQKAPGLAYFVFPPEFPPDLNWRHQLEIADNLAGGLGALHASHYVFGDLNPKNVHVAPNCLVTFVDCDSIQVRDPKSGLVMRCPVGTPEYTAPELHNKDFRTVDRTPASDSFAFAVMMCQLLLVGTHPFAGGRHQTREENILANDSFLLGGAPPRGAPPPSVLPPALLNLLIRCFRDGHRRPSARPSIHEFSRALRSARKQVVQCPRLPQLHGYSSHLRDCPWCLMAHRLGVDRYALNGQRAAFQPQPRGPGPNRSGNRPAPPARPTALPPRFASPPTPVTPAAVAPRRTWLLRGVLALALLLLLTLLTSLSTPRRNTSRPASHSNSPGTVVVQPGVRTGATNTVLPLDVEALAHADSSSEDALPEPVQETRGEVGAGGRSSDPENDRLEKELTTALKQEDARRARALAALILARGGVSTTARLVRDQARAEAVAAARELERQENEVGLRALWQSYRDEWPGDPEVESEQRESSERLSEVRAGRQRREQEARRAALAAALGRDLLSELTFVTIRPMNFHMGCTHGDRDCTQAERPAHEVQITRPYRVAAHETTNGAYSRCVAAEVCAPPHRRDAFTDPAKQEHPVVWVSWEDARTFCTSLGGRLPTEAEWELAARGLLVGARYPNLGDFERNEASSAGTFGRDRWEGTAPVGSFPPNRRGLYDMAGNVKEWTADTYNSYSKKPQTDPHSLGGSELFILRGGAWDQPLAKLRVSAREWGRGTTGKSETIGFRCALDGDS